jgi:hypothetical protein
MLHVEFEHIGIDAIDKSVVGVRQLVDVQKNIGFVLK